MIFTGAATERRWFWPCRIGHGDLLLMRRLCFAFGGMSGVDVSPIGRASGGERNWRCRRSIIAPDRLRLTSISGASRLSH
jgi:hypothetical protein